MIAQRWQFQHDTSRERTPLSRMLPSRLCFRLTNLKERRGGRGQKGFQVACGVNFR
jgi:hypothetical protein